jgi:hypothetical protein
MYKNIKIKYKNKNTHKNYSDQCRDLEWDSNSQLVVIGMTA